MTYFVTVDEDGVVQEPFDDANNNVPDGALPITDAEFKQLSTGFNLFIHDGNELVPNVAAEEVKLRLQLINIERNKAIEAMITGQKAQVNNMSKTALEAAIAAGGL